METNPQFGKAKSPEHFITFLNALVKQFAPVQIYQYAQLAEQRQVNSAFCLSAREEKTTHYLLVITQGSTRIENGMQEFANQHYKDGRVVLHAHGLATLKEGLQNCNRYFSAVLSRGVMLYSADGLFHLAEVQEPSLKKQLEKGRSHWYHRCEMAIGFMHSINRVIADGFYNVCVFLMHQVVEQTCIGLIWVFMGYKSDMHNLKRLLEVCACFSAKPLHHFLAHPADEALLSLMMKSYSAARYKENFFIKEEEAHRLLHLVESFLKMAKRMCDERFEEMELSLAQVVADEQPNSLEKSAVQINTEKGAINND